MLSPLILAGGIGFCVGSVKHGFAVILPFIVLRKFSGGYHAKNLHTCILGSGFLLLLCIICSIHVQCDWRLAITTAIASVSLIVFSPMDSENRRIDRDERRSYKKMTVFCVTVFGVLDIILFLLIFGLAVRRRCFDLRLSSVFGVACTTWIYISFVLLL